MGSKSTIYHAAALFSGRETSFNMTLTEWLEDRLEYNVILPQRDGYEAGNLHQALGRHLPRDEVAAAVQCVVYFLDMGLFLPRSDVVVANLDEPLDEGVVVEISYARLMNKPVIGFRTDVRSPFGRSDDPLGGMHFFPAFQCDVFVHHAMPCQSASDAAGEMEALARRLDTAIAEFGVTAGGETGVQSASNEAVGRVLEGARILFLGVDDVRSVEGLAEVARRYLDNAGALARLAPRLDGASASTSAGAPHRASAI